MPRLDIFWTQIIITLILGLSAIVGQLQCSDDEPQIIFNGDLRLRFCNNTFDEFYNCLCHDNNTRCIAPYTQSSDRSYWSVQGINNANIPNTVDLAQIKHFRCRVPLFFSTGNLVCNKFTSESKGTFLMNSTCQDGVDVTISWEYEEDIELSNWASVLHEAVTVKLISDVTSTGTGQSTSGLEIEGTTRDYTVSGSSSGFQPSTDYIGENQGGSAIPSGMEQSTSYEERKSQSDNEDDDDDYLTPVTVGCTVAGYVILVITSSLVIICRSRHRARHSTTSENKA